MTTDRKQWLAILGLFTMLAVLVLGVALRPVPVVQPDGPLPEPVGSFGAVQVLGGWVSDPEAVAAVQSKLPQPSFRETPAFKAFRGRAEATVLLSDAVKQVEGKHLPARDQGGVGSCVSFGTASAIEYLIHVQVAQGATMQHRDLAQEVIYAGSRVEIGGGKIRGDGSVTAWAGKFVHDWGVVARGTYGSIDLTAYSEKRCREWGKSGVPAELEPVAKQSPVKGITMARSAEEVDRAIRQGYTVAVGSAVGFGSNGPWKRDKDGFLRESGKWGHCMAVVGVRDGARKGFLFLNSWGSDWVSGPTGTEAGKVLDIPPGSFWVEWKTADRMFAEGDCVIFADAVGFPARNPLDDFWINVPVQPRRTVLVGPVQPRKEGALCSLAF